MRQVKARTAVLLVRREFLPVARHCQVASCRRGYAFPFCKKEGWASMRAMIPNEPTSSDIDELLSFLPDFSSPGFRPALDDTLGSSDASGGLVTLGPEYVPVVIQFIEVAARDCWRDPDYLSKVVGTRVIDPNFVMSASLHEIKSILTWCARTEKFCEGHWGEMITAGIISNVLVRLKVLRSQ